MRPLVLAAILALLPACALLEPSGTGRTVTDPTTGKVRDETKADVVVDTVEAAGSILSPAAAPLLGVAGMAAAGLIGFLARKK